MSSALDMSLEDIIKSNKGSSSSRGRGGGGGGVKGRGRGGAGGGPGPSRRFNNRASNRTAPYSKPAEAPNASWKHDMFADTDGGYPGKVAGGGGRGIETGTKVVISNLDYGVSNDDIKELYAEVGDIKRCGVHYDRSGRSEGTADVVFARRGDAVAAVKRYNGVQLDGKPMKVEIVGTNISSGGPARLSNGVFGREIGALRSSGQGQGRNFAGRPRGGGGGGGRGRGNRRGGGRGRGRGGEKEKVSAEDLDADLEKYHAGSMETD